jgi:hypothetical protein
MLDWGGGKGKGIFLIFNFGLRQEEASFGCWILDVGFSF